MSERNDDRLPGDLKAAYGRELPGAEFEDNVLAKIEEGAGGEHEFAVPAMRGWRWWPLAVAAAVVLLLFGAYQVIDRDQVEEDLCRLPFVAAAPAETELQTIIVNLSVSGETTVKGENLDDRKLREYLLQRAKECRADPEHPREPVVLIRAEKDTEWKQVQRIMQLCASAELKIHKIQFASKIVEAPEPAPAPAEESDEPFSGPGTPEVPPAPAKPLSDEPFVSPVKVQGHLIRLARTWRETKTTVHLDDRILGSGKEGFAALERALSGTKLKSAQLEAYPHVPHAEVVRAIDALMKVGIRDIRFVGVPPPEQRPPVSDSMEPFSVHLEVRGGKLFLGFGAGGATKEFEPGLAELSKALQSWPANQAKPRVFLTGAVYLDRKFGDRVIAVLKKHGFSKITMIE